MTKYYVDESGNYIGAFNGSTPKDGSIEVDSPPGHANQKWDGTKYLPYINAYEQIAELELTRTPRREREGRMGVLGAQQWLDDLDAEIEALRP